MHPDADTLGAVTPVKPTKDSSLLTNCSRHESPCSHKREGVLTEACPSCISLKQSSKGPDPPTGNCRAAIMQEESDARNIRYKIKYLNETGENIDEKTQYKPWSDLKPSSEPEDDDGPVLDIVTCVTVKSIALNTSVTSKEDAEAAGGDPDDILKDADLEKEKDQDRGKDYWIQSIESTEMVIRSQALLEVLRGIVDYYPSQQLAGDTVTVAEPYYFLLHHMAELETFLRTGVNGHESGPSHNAKREKAAFDVEVLLTFLYTKFLSQIKEEKARHQRDPPVATYNMMWMLLKPGMRVYNEVDGKLSVCVVKSLTANKVNNPTFYDVEVWSLNFDGRQIGREKANIFVPIFSGEREISSLRLFPVSMARDNKVQKQLEDAGKRYFEVLKSGFQQVKYDGDTLGTIRKRAVKLKGRVILDPASYWSYGTEVGTPPYVSTIDDEGTGPTVPNCECASCRSRRLSSGGKWASYDNLDPRDETLEMTAEHFLLFPRKIWGFLLKTRSWEPLDISNVSPFTPNQKAIENLVMDNTHLKLVQILTHKYQEGERDNDEGWNADFIQSKGEGQIFLLHGPPGVGKTYTAECIAETTRRPLLSLTCADIGIDEQNMEAKLSRWFDLAYIWGAVMLIDEADIYLEERQTGALQRNSLVSAFLRSMEYYRGILFLTTNRVGHIDDAIMSRIHLVVPYKALDADGRMRIWNQFVKKLTEERKTFMVDGRTKKFVKDYFEKTNDTWNGREIRNAVQTAVALAEHDARTAVPPEEYVTLEVGHIESVIQMSQVFKSYLERFKGDEAARALMSKTRNDEEKNLLAQRSKIEQRLRESSKM